MFKPDRAAGLAFAQARGFGTVCAWDGNKPVASSLPFLLSYADDGTPQAAFHVARQNHLAKLADGASWLLAVTGADAYVSPDWYASPDQVPTWLYQSVHLTGRVRKISEDELAPHLDALSAKFEGWLTPKAPWTPSKVMFSQPSLADAPFETMNSSGERWGVSGVFTRKESGKHTVNPCKIVDAGCSQSGLGSTN